MRRFLVAGSLALLSAAAASVFAQSYPSRPIRILVGFAAGSGGLAGVTVTMGSPETRTLITDANGQFSASGLLSGTYHISITGLLTICFV